MNTLDDILKTFKLNPHPEGGAYLETYRSETTSNYPGFNGPRSVSTGIYFLLKENEISAIHRIKSDEMWHFYLGDPLEIVEISTDGKLIKTILGPDILNGQKLQYVVKAKHWFGARPLEGSKFSFVGCTVAPGFDYQDWELAGRDFLDTYPEYKNIISELLTKN